jgi:hypothetical protein
VKPWARALGLDARAQLGQDTGRIWPVNKSEETKKEKNGGCIPTHWAARNSEKREKNEAAKGRPNGETQKKILETEKE